VGQREVKPGEIVRLAWEAEDRVRAGASCLATRKLVPRGELTLVRTRRAGRCSFTLVARRWSPFKGGWIREREDVFDFSDGDAAWRAAIGWDGKGEPEGFARYRRRA
jgi:hypothetical protein